MPASERYSYRFETNTKDPLVRAAFRVGQRAHAGQSRKKIDPKIPYISHPIMVYDLLQMMGVKDSQLLAAAMVHDALEDCEDFKKNPILLQQELYAAMLEENVPENTAAKMSEQIYADCHALTNKHRDKGVDKREEQVKHARSMTLNQKVLKYADQMASIICHIMMADDPKQFTLQQAVNFANKAHDLLQAIKKSPSKINSPVQRTLENEALRPWAELYDKVSPIYAQILSSEVSASDKAAIRSNFNLLDVLQSKAARPTRNPIENVYLRIKIPKSAPSAEDIRAQNFTGYYGSTLTYVDLDEQGFVVGYGAWEADGKKDHPRTQTQLKLRATIEASSTALQLTTGDSVVIKLGEGPEAIQLHEGRHYSMSKPMDVTQFMKFAYDSQACTSVERMSVVEQSRQISHESYMRNHHNYAQMIAASYRKRGAEPDGR